MALLIGVLLALGIGAGARLVGLDRDRAFYPTVTIAIAGYYVLFAAMGGSARALGLEIAVAAAFATAAAVGFRSSLWIVAAALAAHGLFDLAHAGLIENAGVPAWWRDFCLSYDLAAAAFLAALLRSGRLPAAAETRAAR